MKIKRFEDIEAWQLARELIGQPVMRMHQSLLRGDSESVPTYKETRICEGLWAKETDTRCCRVIDA
jgi:hypothetical protein